MKISRLKAKDYSIIIGKNSIFTLSSEIKNHCQKCKKVAIIIDKKIPKKFLTKIKNNLKKRSTIYVDYYSKNKNPYSHLKLNFKNVWFKHPTTFILPKFKDYFPKKNRVYLKKMIKHKIKSLLA